MISPHFPSNFETLGIADETYENLSQSLIDSLTEYYRLDNIDD